MKTTVQLSDFRDAFQRVRPDNFSYDGLEVLFDYLEDCEAGGFRVIHQGTPLSADKATHGEALQLCTVYKLTPDAEMWNGDQGAFVAMPQ